MNLGRRSFVATVAVVMSGCIDGENDTPANDNEETNGTDTENQTDESLNESEYGGLAEEGTRIFEEEVNVELPYGDDYSPQELLIYNSGEKKVDATVRILEDGEVIYSVTLVQEEGRGYRYPEFMAKTGEFEVEVELDEEAHELECKTGPGFSNMAVELPEVKGCTSPKHANITIRRVTETPDEVDPVSSEEPSEYDTVEYYVEWYRDCKDNPEEKDLCATENGELDFARGGVSGRSYEEFERIIEKFPSYGSEEDGYPTTEKDGYPAGTYIRHDGEIYVFRMLFARA
ncbi:hypothetical protein EGH25_01885 [Haladaptatus sp. F3-133]|jgi:hypothetical protein|uniref:Uncharacterized protein n=1 Tax=Halorutilus salinus TaxID=2487751 RepID=A0A9Q4GGU1_9EURY|nr:hypothetical protein [Halorutilus salinus]MCX2818105.1 hypothetical protein [Halorutilus salinus]